MTTPPSPMSPFGSQSGPPAAPQGDPAPFGQPQQQQPFISPPSLGPHTDQEEFLFGPGSPLMPRPKKRPWWPWAAGAAVVLVVAGVTVAVTTSGGGSAANTASSSSAQAMPSRQRLAAMLPTLSDMPSGWQENVKAEQSDPAGPEVGATSDCSAGYQQLYSGQSAARIAARAEFAAPPPPSAPPPPPPPRRPGPPRPPAPLPPPPPPPPPPPMPDQLRTSLAAYPQAEAQKQYQLFVDTLVKCPTFTAPDGTAATVAEGADVNSLGDESDEFQVDFTKGRVVVGHGLIWESRAGTTIWQLSYTYPAGYQRAAVRQLVGNAVAKWRHGQS